MDGPVAEERGPSASGPLGLTMQTRLASDSQGYGYLVSFVHHHARLYSFLFFNACLLNGWGAICLAGKARSSGIEVTGTCEPPDVGSRNQNLKCFLKGKIGKEDKDE